MERPIALGVNITKFMFEKDAANLAQVLAIGFHSITGGVVHLEAHAQKAADADQNKNSITLTQKDQSNMPAPESVINKPTYKQENENKYSGEKSVHQFVPEILRSPPDRAITTPDIGAGELSFTQRLPIPDVSYASITKGESDPASVEFVKNYYNTLRINHPELKDFDQIMASGELTIYNLTYYSDQNKNGRPNSYTSFPLMVFAREDGSFETDIISQVVTNKDGKKVVTTPNIRGVSSQDVVAMKVGVEVDPQGNPIRLEDKTGLPKVTIFDDRLKNPIDIMILGDENTPERVINPVTGEAAPIYSYGPNDGQDTPKNRESLARRLFSHKKAKTPTPEVKNFPVCKIENFRDCPITVDDLFNGNYLKWLQTLSKPFDPAKVKDVPMQLLSDGTIVYDTKTAPNFKDPSTEPFRRDVTAGYVSFQGYDYIVMPVEYFDPKHPDKNQWVITVQSMYWTGHDPKKQNAKTKLYTDVWTKSMKITPILTSDIIHGRNVQDPLVGMTFVNNSDIATRFNLFVSGQDMSALSKPGIVLLNMIGTSSSHWFE